MKEIMILGSTGSIGKQALDVVDAYPQRFRVVGLAAKRNIHLLERQIRKYNPVFAAVADPRMAAELHRRTGDLSTSVLSGSQGLLEMTEYPRYQILLAAIVGFSGLLPTLKAVEGGKTIALANKETLVAAGGIVIPLARETGSAIIPVDSEHSAIFQCLQGEDRNAVARLHLTASGGPFLGMKREELKGMPPGRALKHPRWHMGRKISIDSATLMNKGLEVMEAHWLFQVEYDNIEVLIHPQSIIHSMVEFVDGSHLAQLGLPDMKLPIQYAFSYPQRWVMKEEPLDLAKLERLTFARPDGEAFPCLPLAYEAARRGGTMPAALNAVNEVAVEAYLEEKVEFTNIPHIIETVLSRHRVIPRPTLGDILDTDHWARQEGLRVLK